MKLLLDENMPWPLASAFPKSFTVCTVQQMGWAGIENGRLLSLAADQGFDALMRYGVSVERGRTADPGHRHVSPSCSPRAVYDRV